MVDTCWVPHTYQVGLTRKIVATDIYLAYCISSTMHYLAGPAVAKNTLADNKNSDAPIFKIASLGIVGDLFEIIPQLIHAWH